MLKKFGVVLAFLLFVPVITNAKIEQKYRDETFSGKYISQSIADPVLIEPGETKEVTIKIKNTGQSTWSATGKNFVSVYTVDPNYHDSKFYGKGWLARNQPARLMASTKPGMVGEFKIKLYAPKEGGVYKEQFFLAVENTTWIKGTYFFLEIKTSGKTAKVSTASVDGVTDGNTGLEGDDESINQPYQADMLAFSNNKIVVHNGGAVIPFTVRYHNSGTKDWQKYSWREAGSVVNDIRGHNAVNIGDSSWVNSQVIFASSDPISANQSLNIVFNFRAPKEKGKYIARFQLSADDHSVAGGILELPIEVRADAPADYIEPILVQSEETARPLITEPNIRVGLYKTNDVVEWQSDFSYTIFGGGSEKGIVEPGTKVKLSYKNGEYKFISTDLNFVSRESIRFIPENLDSFFTLINYERFVSWKGKKNFNVYRGVMEYKFSSRSAMPFIINELPLDQYIAGIGETSNGAAMEYIKAILVAARSYAYFHLNDQVKDEKYLFDVYATTVDQLYLGYNSEVLMPRVVQAAQATYGQVVTYKTNPVVVPYFANSDGMTKLWSTVWGGQDKPWIQPVECVYDKGKKKYGHGVGMSAADAATRADKDGWTYDQLLKYYYTGVEVERIY